MASSKTKPISIPTLAGVARHYKVSESSVYGARRKFGPEFPQRRRNGFRVSDLDAFTIKHSLWGRGKDQRANDPTKISYSAARTAYLVEKTAREKLAKEREQVAQQVDLGNIVLMSDVVKIHGQLAAIVLTEVDSIPDAVDVALPREMADEERQRVMEVLNRAVGAVRRAAQEFLKGASDESA